jgi:hypothetical protein
LSHAQGDERTDAFFPLDATGDLLGQKRTDFGRIADDGAAVVGGHGDAGGLQGGFGQFRFHGRFCGSHKAGVVGSGHVEGERAADSFFLRHFQSFRDGRFWAGKDDLAGAIIIGHVEAGGFGDRLGDRGVGAQKSQHPAFGSPAGFLH